MSAANWTPASLVRQAAPASEADLLLTRRTAFARALAGILSVTAFRTIEVTPGPTQILKLSEWQATQNPFGTVLRYECTQTPDQFALHLPGVFVSQLVDLHYGGDGQVRLQSSFTAAELKFVERLGERFGVPLPALCCATAQTEPQVKAQVSSLLDYQGTAREQICLMPFFVEGTGLKSATINCWVAMDVVGKLTDANLPENQTPKPLDPSWQRALQNAALDIPVFARAVLAQSRIGMDRLLALKAGDILPILVRPAVPLVAGGQQIALGAIGEANGMAAFKIESEGETLK